MIAVRGRGAKKLARLLFNSSEIFWDFAASSLAFFSSQIFLFRCLVACARSFCSCRSLYAAWLIGVCNLVQLTCTKDKAEINVLLMTQQWPAATAKPIHHRRYCVFGTIVQSQ